jgi:uncharacterized protein (DUF1330 family)
MIAKNGGRYLDTSRQSQAPRVNRRPPDPVVIIEFPDMGALNAFGTHQQNISPSLPCDNRL